MKRVSLLILLIFVCCLVALSFAGCASDRTQYCYDEMGLFSSDQVAALDAKGQQIRRDYGVDVFVLTCARYGTKAAKNGEDFKREHSLGGNMIVLIINAQSVGVDYHFDVYTFGRAAIKVSDSEVEDMLYSQAGDEILSDDSTLAVQGLLAMMEQGGGAYRTKWGKLVIIALILASIGATAAALGVKRAYSRKRKNVTYPLDKYCRLNLRDRSDTYTHSVTTFVIINNNSSSSGGHSSGGGGGGGHRGGR